MTLDTHTDHSTNSTAALRMHIGCRVTHTLTQPTPLIALLKVHYSRFGDLERADHLVTGPSVPIESFRDEFGNWCTRMMAPAGELTPTTDGIGPTFLLLVHLHFHPLTSATAFGPVCR